MKAHDSPDNKVYYQGDSERRSYILNLILQQVGTYTDGPYADFDKLWNMDGLKERFFASGFIMTKESCLEMGVEEDHIPEILLARWTASRHISERLKEKGITLRACAEQTGIHVSTLTRISTLDRAVALEINQATALAYFVLNESVNKMYLGFDGKVVLPGVLSEVMRMFCALPEEDRRELSANALSQREKWRAIHPATFGPGRHRDEKLLVCERVQEYANSTGRNSTELIRGERIPKFMKPSIRWFFEEEFREKEFFPKMAFLMFLALELRTSMDYFLSEDYAAHVPCYYKIGSEEILIRDLYAINFLSVLTGVDEETSNSLSTPVFWRYYRQN